MKAVHKICAKDDLRPSMGYFQVKDGHVWATNSHMLIKLPTDEVFGDEIIQPGEELYFSAEMWQLMKMDKAVTIFRKDNTFTDTKKGLSVTALTAEEFAEKVGKFPNVPVVVPDEDKDLSAVTWIGMNPKFFLALCEVLGGITRMYFYGEDRSIIIRSTESNGFGMIMPLFWKDGPEHPFKKDEEVDELLK